jgi:hypothetical protein
MLVLSLLTFDVGGTADAKRVETAFRIILKIKRKSNFDQYLWRNRSL